MNHYKSEKIRHNNGLNEYQYTLVNGDTNELLPMLVKIKTAKNLKPMIFRNVLTMTASMDVTNNHTIYAIVCKGSFKIFHIESVDYCWWTITEDCNNNILNSDGDIK
jgi:hypothetical protein